jgi:uncharacterized protein (TIGR02679 family)
VGHDDLTAAARDLAAGPGFGELFAALRDRLEAGGEPATVTLPPLSREARRALADLLGLDSLPSPRRRVRIADVDKALRSSRMGAGLGEVLVALGGPLVDRRADRAGTRAAWTRLWEELHAGSDPEQQAWLEGLRTSGVAARLAGSVTAAHRLLADAQAVVERLPAGAVGLGVLAADVTGDPHALDRGQPLATVVLRWAARTTGRNGVPSAARDWRQLWADVGVVCDPVSASVLVLGLRMPGAGLLARTLDGHARAGEPLRVTLRQLVREPPLAAAAGTVFVCENPAVVAVAADRLGPSCRPLVCVEGMPDTAADRLLARLRDGGVELVFHADFDWGGVRIGNVLATRHGARPWRFRASDYADAVDRHAGTAITPRPAEAVWDPALATALRTHGRRIVEEQVIDDLLGDLVGE